MKSLALLLALSLLCACSQSEKSEVASSKPAAAPDTVLDEISNDVFYLCYSWAGLGSNMGSLAPVFEVRGTHFNYTLQQNSYYGEQTKSPEKICEGEIPEATRNEIIGLVENIEDSVVYKTNIDVMSGGIYSIFIRYQDIDIEFNLHNASDPIAEKIVDLLNTHIPEKHRRLFLWDH